MRKYDLVVASAPNHFEMLKRNSPLYFKYLPIRRILVIGSEAGRDIFADVPNMELIDEELLVKGMTKAQVRRLVEAQGGHMTRSNWYFQQFLKMAYAYVCQDDYYIVWDADTVPVRKIELFDGEKPLFSCCDDYRKDYFITLEHLFHGTVPKQSSKSFIVEHMVIKTEFMQELMKELMNDNGLDGDTFYEKIIKAIDRDLIKGTGFSEFETYANYVLTRHKDYYGIRQLKAFRFGLVLTGYHLNESIVQWLGQTRDTISFEHFCRPSIWRYRWLNENTFRSSTVDEVWDSYEGSFYYKTDQCIKKLLDKRDRIKYLITRVPYRVNKLLEKTGVNK